MIAKQEKRARGEYWVLLRWVLPEEATAKADSQLAVCYPRIASLQMQRNEYE